MLLTQTNRLHLTNDEAQSLRTLCRLSKNLYNVGLYTVRQYFKEIRIYPKYNARTFDVTYIYESNDTPAQVKPNQMMGIDLGMDNLAACVTTKQASFVIDGKRLKSVNQWFNKRNSQLQSEKDKQGIKKFTNQQSRITDRRNRRVRDYLNKAARYIVNHCIDNGIGKVVVGYNPGMKQNSHMGTRNNQNFVQIPIFTLRLKLKSLCERYGIVLVEQEESYTSKSSFVDGDPIPVYNADNPVEFKGSGKRIKRGLYRTKKGWLINADINGAANILRKHFESSQNELRFGLGRGCLAQPLRVNIS